MSQLKKTINQISYEATLKALQARTNGKLNSAASTSILSLLALGLTGCGGGSGTTVPQYSSGGTAVKGPLSNATVFIDLDGDGQLDSDELSTTTAADGSYSFATDDQTLLQGDIIVKTNENTTDASSGETLDGLTLSAAYDPNNTSQVVSPATTLIKTLLDADTTGTLTIADVEADVQAALGITADVDLSTFNPFAADADLAAAKEVEAVAQQIVAIVNTVAVAAEAAGADKEVALTAAIEELADQLDAAAAGSTTVDLTGTAAINDVITAVDTATSTNTDASVATAIANVNTAIDTAVTSATTLDDARETFAIAQSTLTEAAEATATGNTYIATQLGSTTDPTQLQTISAGAISVTGNKASVTESDEAITATGSITLSDPDSTDAITYRVKEGSATLLGSNNLLGGTLTVDADGNWTYNLDVTGDATKLALLQELQAKSYQGDLATDSGTPALANFQIIERFEVQIEKVDATADADNPTVTDATYADTTLIKKVITVVINGTNDAVEATAEGAAISDVTDAAQGTAITNIDTSQYFTDKEVDAADTTGGASGDGDKLTFTAAGLPEGLSINADTGVISGTPSENTLGAYDIVVTATDVAGTSATQSFTVTVANVNDAPIVSAATADTTTNEDAAFTLNASLAFTDADTQFIGDADNTLDNEVLTYTATLADDSALPGWLSIDSATGVLSGTPANGDVGTISVKVTATDVYNASVSDTFDITVANTNDAPTASDKTGVTLGDLNTLTVNAAYVADQTDDDDFTSTNNEVLKVTSVTVVSGGGTVAETSAGSGSWTYTPPDVSEDTPVVLKYVVGDVAGDTASANIEVNVVDAIPVASAVDEDTSNVTVSYDGGTITLNSGEESKGTLNGTTFTPAADFNGIVEFTITLDDGVTELPGILVINKVDDVATIAGDTSGAENEDNAITGTLTATDNEDGLTDGTLWTLKTDAANGTVEIDAATGEWTYTPDANYNGSDSFVVTLTDDDEHTLDQTVNLTVNSVDDEAVIAGDTEKAGDEDTTITGVIEATDAADGLTDGSYFTIKTDAVNGSASIDPASGEWSYTPDENYNGGDSFVITVTDDDGFTKDQVVSLTVNAVNDTPTAGNETGLIVGDSNSITLDLSEIVELVDDVDLDDATPDELTLTNVTLVSGPGAITNNGDGSFTYQPATVADDTPAVISYTVTDNAGATATGTISATVVHAIPLADAVDEDTDSNSDSVNDAVQLAVPAEYTGATISFDANQSSKGTFDSDNLTFTPATNFNGSVNFTIILSDGETEIPGILIVNPTNDTPVYAADTVSATVDENSATTVVVYDASTGASDVDEDDLTYSISGTDAGAFNIDASTGDITFKVSPDHETKASLTATLTITDGDGASDTQTLNVSVTDINDAPEFSAATATGTVAENAGVSTTIFDAAATDQDSGDSLTYSVTGTDAGLVNIDPTTGVVTLKASANFEAKSAYSFNVVATDLSAATATQAVTVSVTNVNEAPTIDSGTTGSVDENAATNTVIYDAAASDVDAGDSVSYSVTGTDSSLITIDETTGEIVLKSSANYETKSSYSFDVVATDADGLTDTESVTVTVADQNDAPTGSVTISGEAKAYETLTASNTLADEDGLGTISYQWYADGSAISGATSSTYEVQFADISSVITVKANYTDQGQNVESVESDATSAVVDADYFVTASAVRSSSEFTDDDTFLATSRYGLNLSSSELDNLYVFDISLDASTFDDGSVRDLTAIVGDIDLVDASKLDIVTGSDYFSVVWNVDAGVQTTDKTSASFGNFSGGSAGDAVADNNTGTSVPESGIIATIFVRAADGVTDLELEINQLQTGGSIYEGETSTAFTIDSPPIIVDII